MITQTPSFSKTFEQKRFFIEDKFDETKKIPVNFCNNTLTITTAYGDKVIFSKSNRGKYFNDSRQKKLISFSEFVSEVFRLLDNKDLAKTAIYQMTGEFNF